MLACVSALPPLYQPHTLMPRGLSTSLVTSICIADTDISLKTKGRQCALWATISMLFIFNALLSVYMSSLFTMHYVKYCLCRSYTDLKN